MPKVDFVVGLGYGDEGKGKTVNYLSDSDTLVVRASAGSNCGHTVVEGEQKHIFHSIGAGTFKGAATYLGPKYRLNPITFLKEYEKLGRPKVFVDLRCRWVTPFDVFINQAIERARGNNRHGSCGTGIGECVERLTYFEDFKVTENLNKIKVIEEEWLPERLYQLELEDVDTSILKEASERFIQDAQEVLDLVDLSSPYRLTRYDKIVFEGNQGLFLDQNSTDFPHVTRANTGIKDGKSLLSEAQLDCEPVINYVSRIYATRHGAGPFSNEIENPGVTDDTNVTNEFQGSLKYGYLDFDRIESEVWNDSQHVDYERRLILNHCDEAVKFGLDTEEILDKMVGVTEAQTALLGYGPASFRKKP